MFMGLLAIIPPSCELKLLLSVCLIIFVCVLDTTFRTASRPKYLFSYRAYNCASTRRLGTFCI